MAKDIEGQNRANPIALLLSSTAMLRHLGYPEHAKAIDAALFRVLESGKCRTVDVHGGAASTTDFTAAVIEALKSV